MHAKRHKRLTVFWNLSNSVREFQKRKKTKLDKENENQKERSKPSKEQKSFLQNFSLNGLVFYWSEGRKIIGDLQILCDNSPIMYLDLSNSLPVFLDDFPGRSFGTKTFISGTEDRFCTKNFFSNFFSVGDMDSARFFRTERHRLFQSNLAKKGQGGGEVYNFCIVRTFSSSLCILCCTPSTTHV